MGTARRLEAPSCCATRIRDPEVPARALAELITRGLTSGAHDRA